jgi:hypothetical protein
MKSGEKAEAKGGGSRCKGERRIGCGCKNGSRRGNGSISVCNASLIYAMQV